jgi:hypothetical protein
MEDLADLLEGGVVLGVELLEGVADLLGRRRWVFVSTVS